MRGFNYTPEQMTRLHGEYYMSALEFQAISQLYPLVARSTTSDSGALGFIVAATSGTDSWHVQLMIAAIRSYDRLAGTGEK